MGLCHKRLLFSDGFPGVHTILTFIKVIGAHRVSDEGWNVGDFSATVEQIMSELFVKLSASGDHVIQDDLLKPRLEEGVYGCVCYHDRARCDPCKVEQISDPRRLLPVDFWVMEYAT